MFRRFSDLALRWARVRPQPEPPLGAPGSARAFRAGPNYYYIRLLRWGGGQIGAAIGILFSIGFTESLQAYFDRAVAARDAPRTAARPSPIITPRVDDSPKVAAPSPPSAAGAPLDPSMSPVPQGSPSPAARRPRNRSGATVFNRTIARTPRWVVNLAVVWFIPFLVFLEYLGVFTFLIQLPLTYALVRIEFEQHWYIVTDRSLRIRTGVLSLSESTMSFANLQQVEVKQGPFQRLLGLADVHVRSAGGGAGSDEGEHGTLHSGVFHSVANAQEIRDLIVARLRAFREEGLGDPGRVPEKDRESPHGVSAETMQAAREVLAQCRALRTVTDGVRPGR